MYNETAVSRSFFFTNSSFVCATRIEPGPSSSGFPQFGICGMSVVNRTTFFLKPLTSTILTGSLNERISISPRSRTTLRMASSIGCFLVVSLIAKPAYAVGGITFRAAPPSMVPILTVVWPKNSSSGNFVCRMSSKISSSFSMAESPCSG